MILVDSSIPFVYMLKLTNNHTVSEICKKGTPTRGWETAVFTTMSLGLFCQ